MEENRAPQVAGVAGFFLALTWLALLLRLYARLCIVKNFGSDDYLAVLAQLFYTAFCSFSITGTEYGTGRHTSDIIPASNLPIALKWWWCCEPAYVISNCCVKLSIGIFLLRITVQRLERFTIYAVMGVSSIVGVMYFWLFIFQCSPPQYFWERYLADAQGWCLDTDIIIKSTYAYSAVCCWSDWTFCILPCILVIPLQMNIRTKISVICLLSMSAITSIATIVRFPYIGGLASKTDFLYETTDVAIWSVAESGLAITTCCAATLRPLVRNFLARSRLLHNSTTELPSLAMRGRSDSRNPWPKSKDPERAGYLRSCGTHGATNSSCKSCSDLDSDRSDVQLRTDLKGGDIGVTTIIYGDNSKRMNKQYAEGRETRSQSMDRFRSVARRGSGVGGSSRDTPWPQGGITKTTEIYTTQF